MQNKYAEDYYKLLSHIKNPEVNLESVDHGYGLLRLMKDHYYYFSKKIEYEDDEDNEDIDLYPFVFFGKLNVYNIDRDNNSTILETFIPDNNGENNALGTKAEIIDLHLMDDNGNNIPFNNENNLFEEGIIKNRVMTFSEKNKFSEYEFFFFSNDDHKTIRKTQLETVDLIRRIGDRFDGLDFLPYLYPNMSEPKLNDPKYKIQKEKGILFNNFVNPVYKTVQEYETDQKQTQKPKKRILFTNKKTEKSLRKPTKAQIDRLFRFLKKLSDINEKIKNIKKKMNSSNKIELDQLEADKKALEEDKKAVIEEQTKFWEIENAKDIKKNSVESLRHKIERLRLEAEQNAAIQEEIKKKIRKMEENMKKNATLGGKTKRRNKRKNTKRRNTQKYRIQHVTTVKKRG